MAGRPGALPVGSLDGLAAGPATRPAGDPAGERADLNATLMGRYGRATVPDSADFAEPHARHADGLIVFLTRRLRGDRSLAEDTAQSTRLTVHVKGSSYPGGRDFRAWLWSIRSRRAIDAITRQGRPPEVSLDRPIGPDDPATFADVLAGDEPASLDGLPGEERRALRATSSPLTGISPAGERGQLSDFCRIKRNGEDY